jgi:hypothetical protein
MARPLIISDCDGVLLEFCDPFIGYLAQVHGLAPPDQLCQHGPADALSSLAGGDIDAVLDGVTIGRPGPERLGVAQADHLAAGLGDQVWQAEALHLGQPARHLGRRRRLLLEGAEAVQAGVAVDGGQGRDVGLGGVPYDQTFVQPFSTAQTA